MSHLNIQENFPLRTLNSYKVGGNALYYCKIKNTEDYSMLLKLAQEKNRTVFILGRGTNIVISDKGLDAFVVKLSDTFAKLSITDIDAEHSILKAGAAASLAQVSRFSIENSLEGMHLLSGIPGTLGGAIYMNAGAYGQEIAKHLIEVTSLDSQGNSITREAKALDFSYRHSKFKTNSECIIEASFLLKKAPKELLLSENKIIMQKRRNSQPLEYPNAGSVFKRPTNGFAGELIEKSGLKGLSIGGAQVSTKHANFIINTGTATAQDIYDLTQRIIHTVHEKTGIRLEPEVLFLGDFSA
ncbi:MAG: UDP-N-acetylmuramate dehydrogenase [Fibrobacter sp.]|jgi:UDP-N-acetylmuramate dehydrogenase|nr:UDP-N-acetylmuramate dehydrogenase [Fibrobacter sp.]